MPAKTRLSFGLVLVVLAAGLTAALPAAPQSRTEGLVNLMPVPAQVTVADGRFRIDESLAIWRDASLPAVKDRAFGAAARFMSRLSGRTGLFLKQDFLAAQSPAAEGGVRYAFAATGRLVPNEDESYALTVEAAGVRLEAKTDLGILHGFETL